MTLVDEFSHRELDGNSSNRLKRALTGRTLRDPEVTASLGKLQIQTEVKLSG